MIALTLFFSNHATARYIVRPLDQAVFHNNQGVQFLNSGNPKKALHEFKLATELSPEFTEGWNNLGLTYMYMNQYEKAKEAFHRSIKIDKKYPGPYNHLATLYYNLGDYEESLKWSNQAIKKDKKFADAYYNKGIALRELTKKTGNPKYAAEGETAFRYATEANSRHYLANFELGNLYREQGKTEQALMRYKIALEIQPSAPQVWTALCDLYMEQGNNNRAQWACDKAIAANPNSPSAHLNLGLVYLKEKNFLLAERELAKAMKANPNNPQIKLFLAYSKLSRAEEVRGKQGAAAATGVYHQALNDYQSVLAQFPKSADAAYNIAYINARLGNLQEAEVWYQKTLAINSNYYKALFGLGLLKIEGGQKKEGVKYLCRFTKVAGADQASAKAAAEKIIAQNGKCK